jgi:hypothetical protein
MRERCQQLRGSLHITGRPGKGTKVTISIPVNAMEILSNHPIDANISLTVVRPTPTENHKNLTKTLQH